MSNFERTLFIEITLEATIQNKISKSRKFSRKIFVEELRYSYIVKPFRDVQLVNPKMHYNVLK